MANAQQIVDFLHGNELLNLALAGARQSYGLIFATKAFENPFRTGGTALAVGKSADHAHPVT